VLQRAPALLELGSGALAQGPIAPHEGVEGTGVRPACSRMQRFMPLRVDHFAEKTSLVGCLPGCTRSSWVPLLRVHLGCRVSGKPS
jgi:hypothetical protein